jgi:NifU-like protein involved in Fe-S cluster formation
MMDETVIKYYKRLLKSGFENTGSIEKPSIFLDSVSENVPLCSMIGRVYLNLFINVKDNMIENIKYLCTCDPTANVAIEILCKLIKGKTLTDAEMISPDSFSSELGTTDEEFLKKSAAVIELLQKGLKRYHSETTTV